MTTEDHDENRHAGSFVTTNENNRDLNGRDERQSVGPFRLRHRFFEQAVGYGAFTILLDWIERSDLAHEQRGRFTGRLQQRRAFEFGLCKGKDNYQIYDGIGADKADSGVPFSDSGVIVTITITITGEDSYDLEIQTATDKKLTKLPDRKLANAVAINFSSFCLPEVRPARLERATYGFGGRHSIQLSYGRGAS